MLTRSNQSFQTSDSCMSFFVWFSRFMQIGNDELFLRYANAGIVLWIGGDGGWQDVANWSSNPDLPGPLDDVIIARPINVIVTHPTGDHTINSLVSCEALVISGGSLSFTSTSKITGSATLSNGSIGGGGEVTFYNLTWTGGTMSGSGTTVIPLRLCSWHDWEREQGSRRTHAWQFWNYGLEWR